MSDKLDERLNKILPKITSADFLSGDGIGNEIAFYIFDYPPEAELRMREHIEHLKEFIPKTNPALRVGHVNLFDLVLDVLDKRGYLEKSLEKQRREGDEAFKKSVKGLLDIDKKLAPALVEAVQPHDKDFVLIDGVGSAWPLVTTHSLLNSLQSRFGQTPLVIFYPGTWDGISFQLFGKAELNKAETDSGEPYYRAFQLI